LLEKEQQINAILIYYKEIEAKIISKTHEIPRIKNE